MAASSLTIMALAELFCPHPADAVIAGIELKQSISGTINQEYSLAIDLNESDSEIVASLSLDVSNRNAIIDTLQLPGNLEGIHIDRKKKLAYLANSFSGLQIVDISDPAHLRILSSLLPPGRAWDITVRGDILFLASAEEGLHLIDISRSDSPTILSQLKLNQHMILKLEIVDKTIYATTGKKGLLVIDISDTKAPRLVKTLYADMGAWGLLADKDTLYVSCGRYRLDALDISNRLNPKKIDETPLPGSAWDMAMRDQVLYLPIRNSELVLIDTSKPNDLTPLDVPFDLVSPNNIDMQHDRAYISSQTGRLSIIDLTDPRAPQLSGTYDLPHHARNIAISDRVVYVSAGINGLQALDLDKLAPAEQIKNLKVKGNLQSILFGDNFFYLATKNDGLYVAERGPSGEPGAIVAALPLDGYVMDMVRYDDYLFIACSKAGLRVVDISNPTAPTITAPLDIVGNFKDITIVENRLFLADYATGIRIVDITNPGTPIEIGQFELQKLKRLSADDKHLYAATAKSGLYIFDHSAPNSLAQIGNIDLPWPLQSFVNIKQLAIAGQNIYMAGGTAGLLIFDISDRTTPQLTQIINLEGDTQAVTIDSSRIFVSTRQGKLWLLNQAPGNKTRRLAVSDSLGSGINMIIDGDKMILANGIKGLTLLPLPQIIDISSHPAMMQRADRSGWATLKIPPQSTPGVYNLIFLQQGEVKEFIGAVKLNDIAE
jgi:hypothetical protein